MHRLYEALKKLIQGEDGPTAVEYAVMLALIVVVCATAISAIGNNATTIFNNVSLNEAAASSSS